MHFVATESYNETVFWSLCFHFHYMRSRFCLFFRLNIFWINLSILFFTLYVLGFDGGLRNSPSAGQRHEESRHHIRPHLILFSREPPKSPTEIHPLIIWPSDLQPKDLPKEHHLNKNRLEAFVPKERLLKRQLGDLFFLNYLFILVITSRSTGTTPFCALLLNRRVAAPDVNIPYLLTHKCTRSY